MIALAQTASPALDAAALRDLVLAAGADDMGFVSMDDPALDDQRADILAAFPFARTLISFVVRMNRENIRSPARSFANLEFHHTNDECDDASRRIVKMLEARGVRAGYPPVGFPMEAARLARQDVGRSRTSPSPSRRASGAWASIAMSSIRNSAISFCLARSRSTSMSRMNRRAARLQSLPRMQALRRRLSDRRHCARRPFRFRRLLHA